MITSMSYTYRKISKNDVPLLEQLLKIFGDAFNEVETYQKSPPSPAYLRSLLEKDTFVVVVAQDGATVVGGLAAYVLEKFEQERKEVYIYDLAVEQSHRRKGIATGLINELKRIAKKLGAYIMFVQADLVDEPAVKLYESFGKGEDVLQFDIPVERDQ